MLRLHGSMPLYPQSTLSARTTRSSKAKADLCQDLLPRAVVCLCLNGSCWADPGAVQLSLPCSLLCLLETHEELFFFVLFCKMEGTVRGETGEMNKGTQCRECLVSLVHNVLSCFICFCCSYFLIKINTKALTLSSPSHFCWGLDLEPHTGYTLNYIPHLEAHTLRQFCAFSKQSVTLVSLSAFAISPFV